jgi:hypothetical protein
MDFYALLRMFTNFDMEKSSPSGCPIPRYMTMVNAIFYGGQFHASVYATVLKLMGFSPELKVEKANPTDNHVTLSPPFDFFAPKIPKSLPHSFFDPTPPTSPPPPLPAGLMMPSSPPPSLTEFTVPTSPPPPLPSWI